MIDIPTALTPAETAKLQEVARGKVVYEAGALLGYSTVALAQVAKRVISVDPHTGYPQPNATSTWEQYLYNLERYGVLDRVRPFRADFQVHIPDGTDFIAWGDLTGDGKLMEEFLRTRGFGSAIVLHDYGRGGCSESTKAIDRYIKAEQPVDVEVVDTLIVIRRY